MTEILNKEFKEKNQIRTAIERVQEISIPLQFKDDLLKVTSNDNENDESDAKGKKWPKFLSNEQIEEFIDKIEE